MSEILSSLEHEFARQADADRDTEIARLRKLEAAGRGRVEITPASLILGLIQIAVGAAILYYTVSASEGISTTTVIGGCLGGALFLALGLWMIVLSRKPLFVLTEEGVEIRGTLLPWTTVDDYEIEAGEYLRIPVATTIVLYHAEGHVPAKPPVFRIVRNIHNRKTGVWRTFFLVMPKARRLSGRKLSDAIGRFLAGAHARQALEKYANETRG